MTSGIDRKYFVTGASTKSQAETGDDFKFCHT